MDFQTLASLGRVEQELFGGVPDEFAAVFQQHQLGTPQRFLFYFEHLLKEWMGINHKNNNSEENDEPNDAKQVQIRTGIAAFL